jgi:hypothetical protein
MIAEHNPETLNAELNQLLSHLDKTAVLLTEYGCYIALTDDKRVIFSCPTNIDGSPERYEDDYRHMNWGQVTAPEPVFLQVVNETFGTSFDSHEFSGS